MFSDLAGIRSAVTERLTPELPTTWKARAALGGVITSSVPVWYVEFTRFESSFEGEDLPRGQVACHLRLIVTDPKTDAGKAEDDVDQHVLDLITAVDQSNDLFWSTGQKRRLETGELAWIIDLVAPTETPTEPPTEE